MNEVQTGKSRPVDVKRELVMLSLPAIAGQAIDPLTLLMETAYIGRLGLFSFFFLFKEEFVLRGSFCLDRICRAGLGCRFYVHLQYHI